MRDLRPLFRSTGRRGRAERNEKHREREREAEKDGERVKDERVGEVERRLGGQIEENAKGSGNREDEKEREKPLCL